MYPNIINYYNGIKGNKTKKVTVNFRIQKKILLDIILIY